MGHVDSHTGPAVGFRLHEWREGEKIVVAALPALGVPLGSFGKGHRWDYGCLFQPG